MHSFDLASPYSTLPHTVGCLSRTRHKGSDLSVSSLLFNISNSEIRKGTLDFHGKSVRVKNPKFLLFPPFSFNFLVSFSLETSKPITTGILWICLCTLLRNSKYSCMLHQLLQVHKPGKCALFRPLRLSFGYWIGNFCQPKERIEIPKRYHLCMACIPFAWKKNTHDPIYL